MLKYNSCTVWTHTIVLCVHCNSRMKTKYIYLDHNTGTNTILQSYSHFKPHSKYYNFICLGWIFSTRLVKLKELVDFSVPKATLLSQMSVCLSVYLSAKPLFMLYPSSFIPHFANFKLSSLFRNHFPVLSILTKCVKSHFKQFQRLSFSCFMMTS